MNIVIKMIPLLGLLAVSQLAFSAPIADTFASGDTLRAAALSNIKDAVNDNSNRINALASAPGLKPDYSGYSTPFSVDRAMKNVIVAKSLNGDGSGNYYAQIFYENSTEQVQIGGVMVTPPFIGKYVTASFDNSGNLIYLETATEAPETPEYLDYQVEYATFDLSSGMKTVTDDSYSYSETCTKSGALGACDETEKQNGVQVGISQSNEVRSLLGAGGIGTMSFSALLSREKYSGTRRSHRVHAKGIGRILRVDTGRVAQRAIYYNVDGVTGGSLVGTPFESGAMPFGDLFF